MIMKNLAGNTKNLLKAFGLMVAVALSLLFAGVGSTLSGQNLDLGDPIPGHCAYEDPGSWVTEEGGCKDVEIGVVYSWWSVGNPYGPSVYTQPEAIAYCEALVQGGYDDWALPSKDVMLASAANGAYGHLNFDVHLYTFMSSSSQGKKFPFVVSFKNLKAYALGPGSNDPVICARNLPTKKPKK